ncbi:MAG TPA: cytochrome c family protein [Paracoccaceae bacterium]|nr:cytochrome c family protein [Paracoccaceae bacterium]
MNTMEVTKVVGALCGSLLIFLLAKWGAETLYHGGGHGEGEAAYTIEVAEIETASDAEEGPSFEEVLAAADAGKGEKVFGKCKACHSIAEGENKTGPSLYGVVDRAQGSMAGFGYSAALSGLGGVWTADDLNKFLTRPADYAPGTSMSFAGLKKEDDRANLIVYLQSLSN